MKFTEKIENLPEAFEIYLSSMIRINETLDLNNRKESEQYFLKVLELLSYKKEKKNIAKAISTFEEILKFHHRICLQRGVGDIIKLEFETQINETNDEVQAFKVYHDKLFKIYLVERSLSFSLKK